MKTIKPKYPRILAIAPTARGFGFAVFEGQDTLVDWGGKRAEGDDKNAESLTKVEEMIAHYEPQVMVMEDTSAKGSRRAPRIRELSQKIKALASNRKVQVVMFSRGEVMQMFFADGEGTQYEIAKIIAERFSEELGFQLPPKRRPWEGEDPRMDIFAAVALALTFRKKFKGEA